MRLSLVCLAGVLGGVAARTPVPELSLEAPFLNHDYHNQNYEMGGSVIMSKNQCKLTGDIQDQRGWLMAQRRNLPENFEIEVEFLIDGAGRALYGDGMAIWFLAPEQPVSEGPVFGLSDHFKGTALLIDTYRNNRPGKSFPYLMLMQNDGTIAYDSEHDGKANELAGFSVRGLHSPTHRPSKLRISYFVGGELSVDINYRNKWERAFALPFNLVGAQKFALSASTGELSESHEIISIKVWELEDRPPQAFGKYADHQDYTGLSAEELALRDAKKSGSWLWFIAKWTLYCGAIYGGYKRWVAYRRPTPQGFLGNDFS